MKIDHIIWISEDAEEALLTIRDNSYSCEAFCQPCTYKTGDIIRNPLLSFAEGEVIKVDHPLLLKKTSFFGHEIVANVQNINKKLVTVGNIIIELSLPLPRDIKNGEKVLFYTTRLDAL